jgi:hypothetical protein
MRVQEPQYVDCNAEFIVVSESPGFISLFSVATGGLQRRLFSLGDVPVFKFLQHPRGVRLLSGGQGVAVADSGSHRICVFNMDGTCRAVVGSRAVNISSPSDVMEYPSVRLCLRGGVSDAWRVTVSSTWPRSLLSCLCASVPLCLCASVPLCLCASVPLCLCASVPLCLCAVCCCVLLCADVC